MTEDQKRDLAFPWEKSPKWWENYENCPRDVLAAFGMAPARKFQKEDPK